MKTFQKKLIRLYDDHMQRLATNPPFDPRELLDYGRKSLELSPGEASALFNIGSFSLLVGRFEEGVQYWRQALDIDHPNTSAFILEQLKFWESQEEYKVPYELAKIFYSDLATLGHDLAPFMDRLSQAAADQTDSKIHRDRNPAALRKNIPEILVDFAYGSKIAFEDIQTLSTSGHIAEVYLGMESMATRGTDSAGPRAVLDYFRSEIGSFHSQTILEKSGQISSTISAMGLAIKTDQYEDIWKLAKLIEYVHAHKQLSSFHEEGVYPSRLSDLLNGKISLKYQASNANLALAPLYAELGAQLGLHFRYLPTQAGPMLLLTWGEQAFALNPSAGSILSLTELKARSLIPPEESESGRDLAELYLHPLIDYYEQEGHHSVSSSLAHVAALRSFFPHSILLDRFLAATYKQKQQWEEAKNIYLEILNRHPHDIATLVELCNLLILRGDHSRDEELISKIEQELFIHDAMPNQNPSQSEGRLTAATEDLAQLNLFYGIFLNQRGHRDHALKHFKQAHKMRPADHNILTCYQDVLKSAAFEAERNDPKKSLKYFEALLEITDPNSHEFHLHTFNAGAIHINSGNAYGALEIWTPYLGNSPVLRLLIADITNDLESARHPLFGQIQAGILSRDSAIENYRQYLKGLGL